MQDRAGSKAGPPAREGGFPGLREFFNTTAGKVTAVAIVVVALGLMAVQSYRGLGPADAARASRDRMFICSETGKSFGLELEAGMHIPVHSSYSAKQTGYPAELCFWTKDGKTKTEPTLVLLNSWTGKPGPTFCPDCGRLVISRNPPPGVDAKPPPPREEYRNGPDASAR